MDQLRDIASHNFEKLSSSSSRDARALKSGEALRGAILALLERKPLDQITVREIAAQAEVHYATFFRHHPSKQALLDHVATEQINHLVALTVPVLDRSGGVAATTALLAYVDAHRPLWTALLAGAAGTMREALLVVSLKVARDRGVKDGWPPTELAINYSVSLVFETLAWWLSITPDDAKRERLANTLQELLIAVAGARN